MLKTPSLVKEYNLKWIIKNYYFPFLGKSENDFLKDLCDQEAQLKSILDKLCYFYGDKWNELLNKEPTTEIEIQKQNLSMRSAPLMIAILNFTNFLPSISFLCSSFVIREILFWFCQKIC